MDICLDLLEIEWNKSTHFADTTWNSGFNATYTAYKLKYLPIMLLVLAPYSNCAECYSCMTCCKVLCRPSVFLHVNTVRSDFIQIHLLSLNDSMQSENY